MNKIRNFIVPGIVSIGLLFCVALLWYAYREEGWFRKESMEKQESFFGAIQVKAKNLKGKDGEAVIPNPEGEMEGIIVKAGLKAEDWDVRHAAGLTNQAILNQMGLLENRYAFSLLKPDEKQLYAELYLILAGHHSEVPLCETDPEILEYVEHCVYLDCPELFYANGCIYTKMLLGDTVCRIIYEPVYTMSKDEADACVGKINEYSTNALAGIAMNSSVYDKVKHVYEYVILNTEYELNSKDDQNICSVFLYGKSVCMGYSRAVQYLLRELGIESCIVYGHSVNGEAHSWNLVDTGNAYYFVDATWGDSSYLSHINGADQLISLNYDYLFVTNDDLSNTHVIDSRIPIPRCVSDQYNFYVKEKLYVEEVSVEEFLAIFGTEAFNELPYVAFRCKDEETYREVRRHLIDENHIFDYLDENVVSLNFTYNEIMHTYTFLF